MKTTLLFVCFIVSSIATLGSLFFSEVMLFVPCSLCWYQRIFMYSVMVLLFMNILFPEDNMTKYLLVLTFFGLCFSIYHNLLMFDIIPETLSPCIQGIACSTQYINWFGFITIPLLALGAFIVLSSLLMGLWLTEKNKGKE